MYKMGLNNTIRDVWYWLCENVLVVMPTKTFYRLLSFVQCLRLGGHWYWFDLKNPQTFNEKINYLKLFERNPLSPIVADKLTVRDYVKDTVGEEYLIPIIGIYSSADEINFKELPKKFVLKTNHGSGWNLICHDKNQLSWEIELKKVKSWLKKNAYYLSREWQYKYTKPQLIHEELLEYEIDDYKFFCDMGEPRYIQVDSDRFSNHQRTVFDTSWDEVDMYFMYPRIESEVPKPSKLNEMLLLAKKLSKPFIFCRVDLYEYKGKVFFGEITLHPGGGSEPFREYKYDLLMGGVIDVKAICNKP